MDFEGLVVEKDLKSTAMAVYDEVDAGWGEGDELEDRKIGSRAVEDTRIVVLLSLEELAQTEKWT